MELESCYRLRSAADSTGNLYFFELDWKKLRIVTAEGGGRDIHGSNIVVVGRISEKFAQRIAENSMAFHCIIYQ
jgi:hypothetical protein